VTEKLLTRLKRMTWMVLAVVMGGQVNTGQLRLTDRDLVKNLSEAETKRLIDDWKVAETDAPDMHTKKEWVVFAMKHGRTISVSHDLDSAATAITFGSSVSLPNLKDPNRWVAKEAPKLKGKRLVQVTTSLNSSPTRIFTLFETIDLSKGLTIRALHRQFDAYIRTLDQLARAKD
jgi:hypothetical protein